MESISLTVRKNSGKDDGGEKSNSTLNVRQNVSFKFSKQVPKKLTGNKLSDEDRISRKNDRELILSVEGKEIKSTIPKEEKKELIIPMIKYTDRRPRLSHPTDSDSKSGEKVAKENKLNDLAIKELLKETAVENEKWERREFQNFTVTIPLAMQKKVPEAINSDAEQDATKTESTLDDYDKIPVDGYGVALTRGMGWNPGGGIGKNNQQSIDPLEPTLRPKGMGLGADKSVAKPIKKHNSKDEELKLVDGAYVHVLQGTHKGFYGQVEGLDAETARVFVKLSTSDKNVSLPELYIEVVSKKEYQKESKVINRKMYDKYKKDQEITNGDHVKHTEEERNDLVNNHSSSNHKRKDYNREDRERSNDCSSSSYERTESSEKSRKKRKHSKERRREKKRSSSEEYEYYKGWVCPQLKVRLIDQHYKKGKYFNQKICVEDVLSPKSCVCRTEDGKYLEDISPSMLETVIPRSEPGYVMIVQGKYKGQLGTILKRDKSSCVATVQFLSDREKVTKLEYDSLCEYIGDVSQFD